MLCPMSQTMSTGVDSNGTDAGGRAIDAETAPSSWLMSPKSLMTLLPRQARGVGDLKSGWYALSSKFLGS